MSEHPSPRGRRPVVVVHGYLASKEMMIPLRSMLENAGFDAHIAQLPPLLLGKVEPMAGLLAREVDRVLEGTPRQRVDLVGVSLGGLLGLRYLQRFRGSSRVRRFVTIGTPFRGSWAARAATALLGKLSPAAEQLLPHSEFIRALNREGLPDGVGALSICATRDLLAPPHRCVLGGADQIEIPGPGPAAATHQALVVSGDVGRLVVDFLDRREQAFDLTRDVEPYVAAV